MCRDSMPLPSLNSRVKVSQVVGTLSTRISNLNPFQSETGHRK